MPGATLDNAMALEAAAADSRCAKLATVRWAIWQKPISDKDLRAWTASAAESVSASQASPGDSRFSGHGLVRQLQDGQDLIVRQTETLFLHLEAGESLEAEPRMRWHLPQEVLLDGAVE
jgi:hypothetical protein